MQSRYRNCVPCGTLTTLYWTCFLAVASLIQVASAVSRGNKADPLNCSSCPGECFAGHCLFLASDLDDEFRQPSTRSGSAPATPATAIHVQGAEGIADGPAVFPGSASKQPALLNGGGPAQEDAERTAKKFPGRGITNSQQRGLAAAEAISSSAPSEVRHQGTSVPDGVASLLAMADQAKLPGAPLVEEAFPKAQASNPSTGLPQLSRTAFYEDSVKLRHAEGWRDMLQEQARSVHQDVAATAEKATAAVAGPVVAAAAAAPAADTVQRPSVDGRTGAPTVFVTSLHTRSESAGAEQTLSENAAQPSARQLSRTEMDLREALQAKIASAHATELRLNKENAQLRDMLARWRSTGSDIADREQRVVNLIREAERPGERANASAGFLASCILPLCLGAACVGLLFVFRSICGAGPRPSCSICWPLSNTMGTGARPGCHWRPRTGFLGPAFREVGLESYTFEVSEIQVGRLRASGDLQVSLQMGRGQEIRTEAIETKGSTLLRFRERLQFGARKFDRTGRLVLRIVDRERVTEESLASLDITAQELFHMVHSEHGEYFCLDLAVPKRHAVQYRHLPTTPEEAALAPYVAMRLRDVTDKSWGHADEQLKGKAGPRNDVFQSASGVPPQQVGPSLAAQQLLR